MINLVDELADLGFRPRRIEESAFDRLGGRRVE
jgi:hypothetical protein